MFLLTPILTRARVPLLGTDIEAKSRNMKKSRKMENVGSPILTIIVGRFCETPRRLTQTPYKVTQGTASDSHASYKRDEPC